MTEKEKICKATQQAKKEINNLIAEEQRNKAAAEIESALLFLDNLEKSATTMFVCMAVNMEISERDNRAKVIDKYLNCCSDEIIYNNFDFMNQANKKIIKILREIVKALF